MYNPETNFITRCEALSSNCFGKSRNVGNQIINTDRLYKSRPLITECETNQE